MSRIFLLPMPHSKTLLQFRTLAAGELAPRDLLLLADPDNEAIDRYLHKSAVVLAVLDEKIIGIYVLYPHNSACAEIKNIAIAETEQGKGYGRQLLEHAITSANTLGFQELLIGTANTSFGQLALYQKLGFRLFELRKNYFIQHYSEPLFENGLQVRDMLMFQLKLSPDTNVRPAIHLNQLTLPVRSVATSLVFYQGLGLTAVVLSLPHYVRLVSGNGTTLSLEEDGHADGKNGAHIYFETERLDEVVSNLQIQGYKFETQPTDQSWLWREARLIDPDGHILIFYHAGEIRLNPPWRVKN